MTTLEVTPKQNQHSTVVRNYDKMNRRIQIIFVLTTFLTSCSSLSKLGIQDYKSDYLLESDYNKLNGTYCNYPYKAKGEIKQLPYSGKSKHLRLFNHFVIGKWNGREEDFRNQSIKIEFVNNNKAIVTLFRDDEILVTQKIKGHFKKGYFYSRPKIIIIPIIPLIFGYYFDRYRIGKHEDYLTIDYTVNKWMSGFVVGESSKGFSSSIFKQKKEK